ncbi:MaoC/PaaZ C-terminal domain-containing protein [Bradyrhizobium septentrionale]|uniref:MaoC family dehydratase N-terminal domain-containing protein n=1 Tax=Bradyrhizobium septentrionale TaxID=1404411 RepID=A0A973W3G7_9BRAD|nr:MaoC/PaaZ C-terminal domain-containing protein [Bradyrhizobium septentrionale]UGY15321.1 MaoC family dehydratase N-terminal domain-containing protein [Bradyrhizobium septentrionale]UGY23905.1 MaoC family dehydratase N-terminal domain-containing protein [Bradyrhizobium septentrionale]
MLYAEDLTEGQTFQLGSYTIGEAEILAFAGKYDPVPIHTDPTAAAAGPFGGLIASGFNTIAIYQRLVVEAIWSKVAGIVGRSLEIRLPSPVRPGATLTGQSQIQRITIRPERRDAVVIFRTELVNDEQRPVLVVVLDALIHMRPAAKERA